MNRPNVNTLGNAGGLLAAALLGVAAFGCNALSGASSSTPQGFGPNMLTSQPVFWTDPTAQATRDIEGRSYTFRISSTGPKPWGVQQYWVVPPPNAGDKMRVQFEAQGTRGMNMVVKFQRNGPPFDAFGLEQTIPLTADWKRHEIEFTTNGTTDECQLIFWCSSVPGTVSIRSVTLQKKELANAPVKSGGAPQPVKSISELFDYYDLYVARYKDKDAAAITSAWAPGYKDWFGDTMPSSSEEAELAGRERLELQMRYSGQFTNGPDQVFATNIAINGDTAKVTGYRSGSYKFLTPEGGLQQGGSSFSNVFTDTWTRKNGVWLIRKTITEKYVEENDTLTARSRKAHDALRAKYGVKKPAPNSTTAVSGVFLGTLYVDGQPSGRSDRATAAAQSVRLTLDKAGSYMFEQLSSGLTRIEGGSMLIASGKASWKGNECTLTPDKKGPSELSVCGWSFNTGLTLKREADGSLSLLGKPNGMTDPLPRGQELRFRP